MISRRHNCILIGVLCAVSCLTYAARVSEVPCPNGSECGTIDHSTCTSGKCQCSTGFDEDLKDGSACVQVVSGVSCTGTAQCPGIDNSVCSSGTCACKNGFTESANTCVKVFGTACTGSSACPGDVNSLCKNDKCACADNYEEKNGICTLTVSSKTCSANGNECYTVPNAECDVTATKCKCSDGYAMNVDVCAAENAVVSGVSCTGTAQCPGIDNSVCSSGTCACKNGFTESANTCVKVFGTACTGSSACPGDVNSLCKNDKCACADNYEEKNGICTLTVSSKTCSANGNECYTVPNAECDVTATKCKCSDGYAMNVDVCAAENAVVSGVSCTGTAQCPGIDNSVCSSGTCACKNGFTESANTCVKVFGTACTGSSACPGDVNSLCKNDKCACADNYEEKNGICTLTVSSKTCSANGNECDTVPNAECDVTATKCKCSDGYAMNIDVCAAENAVLSVNTITCTVSGKECENVPNAECDVAAKKCKCSNGHVMNVNVCAAENAAATLRIGAATLLLLVIPAVCN